MTARRVALYARVSTHDQDASPQLARLRAWAAQQGFQVHAEHVETASGRLVRRPAMDAIMALVRGHHVHAVAVVKLDRWGRSLLDLRRTVEQMVEAGVTFYAIESGIAYEKHTATGKLFLSQLAAFAEFEADLISDRTREALAGKGKDGPWVSKAGRLVERLGRPLKPCSVCGGARAEDLRMRRAGTRVPVCAPCKARPEMGIPAALPVSA
jgi:DNA invertase Pin-like site-specific DNA recombinase